MKKTIKVTYNPLVIEMQQAIDREILGQMFKDLGESNPYEKAYRHPDTFDAVCAFLAHSATQFKIVAIEEITDDSMYREFEIIMDTKSKSTYEENFDMVKYQMIANEV